MRTQNYARLVIAFRRGQALDERVLRAELAGHGFDAAHMSYRVGETGEVFEYRMMIQTTRPENFGKLAQYLSSNPLVKEFRIAPTGD